MRCTLLALTLLAVIGCTTQAPTNEEPGGRSVELRRWMDNLGISHNDVRTVTDPNEINRLRNFLPEMQTTHVSDLHGPWQPLLLLKFHNNDESETIVTTDYHLYRMADGARGDFIVKDGFSDEVDHIFAAPPTTPQ